MHSLLKYGIVFWGNTSFAKQYFKLQKKALRLISDVVYRAAYRGIFKELKIMTLPSIFIFESICFIKNHQVSPLNSEIHHYQTRNRDVHGKSIYQDSAVYESKICQTEIHSKKN
ncbi:uncharacterized protein LOC124614056 [Schistocerca americana]|uniref:uncharacterized protein LOC124614056 n=1 Tax=Schistocerca americana TaxID=7009 RepID=UPI001F4FA043|nr:uncharacterized protein LOC124614056 [Schistocerca americana]